MDHRAHLSELLARLFGDTSQADVARELKQTASQINQYLKGNALPTFETLARIARKYGPDALTELVISRVGADIERSVHADLTSRDALLDAISERRLKAELGAGRAVKKTGRTLRDFPDAFEPLTLVTGDKRETRSSWIGEADFGAYSATPADTRWILNLGLSPSTVKHIDKNFVLMSEEELIDRYAEQHLLVVGSPAANHLARMVNETAIFKFNYHPDVVREITDLIERAKLAGSTRKREAMLEENEPRQRALLRLLFTGGIIDPTFRGAWVSGQYSQLNPETPLDFGVITICENPFWQAKCARDPALLGTRGRHEFVSIMAAGLHHPGTAHALRRLGKDARKARVFESHPLGGVLRVTMDGTKSITIRTEEAECHWESDLDPDRRSDQPQERQLRDGLEALKSLLKTQRAPLLHIDNHYIDDCVSLLDGL